MSPFVGNGKILWRIVPFSILWSNRKKRNERMFRIKESSWASLLSAVYLRIAKWACARKECSVLKIDNILQSWGPCLKTGVAKKKTKEAWCSLTIGV